MKRFPVAGNVDAIVEAALDPNEARPRDEPPMAEHPIAVHASMSGDPDMPGTLLHGYPAGRKPDAISNLTLTPDIAGAALDAEKAPVRNTVEDVASLPDIIVIR